MPGTGGRFGWNDPPPAGDHHHLAFEHLAVASVFTRKPSLIFSIVSTISLRWKAGWNG